MSGPLKVTHLLAFSQSRTAELETNVNLRLYRLPRGPTLTFKVLRFALVRDVANASKHPHSPGHEFQSEPLLILNNFGGEDKQLKLMTTMFQNLFPAIHVQSMPLTKARRVVLLSYNAVTRTIDLRHYLITVRPVGVSRTVRKIVEGSSRSRRSVSVSSAFTATSSGTAKGVPDLSSVHDVAEYVLGQAGGDTSASEAESEAESDAGGAGTRVVDLPADYIGRGNKRSARRAIRLTELGPRLELGLVKIEDGLGDGEVLFHEFGASAASDDPSDPSTVRKTQGEAAATAKAHAARKKETAARRAQQEANVRAKQAAAAPSKGKGRAVEEPAADDAEESDGVADFEFEDMVDADVAGEEFDPLGVLDEVLDDERSGSDPEAPSDEEDDAPPPPPAKRAKADPAAPKAKFSMRGRAPVGGRGRGRGRG